MALDRAIDEFVMAAASPAAWPEALQAVAEGLGADGATLIVGTSVPRHTRASTAIDDIVREYFVVGAPIDVRETRVWPTTRDDFLGDFDSFTADEIARDPFYAEFLRPRGFGWHANAALSDGPEPLMLNLKRRWTRGPYQRADLRRISAVLPHLRAAARHARIGLEARSHDHLASQLALGLGALLIDMHGAVIDWNERVVFGDGLALHDRRLVTSAGADQAGLDRAIDLALAIDRPSDLPPPAPCVVRRPSGRRPLIVHVAGLFAGDHNPVADARAIVSIVDPDATRSSPPHVLRALFGLTPREVDIALLLGEGLGLADIAERSRISLAHVRQRLKVIQQKTATVRQGELIALLSRIR